MEAAAPVGPASLPTKEGRLADAYGVTDTDGSRPDCWGYLADYGWECDDGHGIDQFR